MNRTQRRAMAGAKSKTMEDHFMTTAKILEDIDRRLCKLEGGLELLEEFLEEFIKKGDKNDKNKEDHGRSDSCV